MPPKTSGRGMMQTLGVGLAPAEKGVKNHRSKYSAEGHEKAVQMAGEGASNQMISRVAFGMHPDSMQDWLRLGRTKPDEYPEYAALEQDLEQARAELGHELVQKVVEEAKSGRPQTWQAAMTWLERRFPSEWSKHETRRVEGQVESGPAQLPNINVLVLNDPNARAAHADLLRSISGPRPGIPERTGMGSEREDDPS